MHFAGRRSNASKLFLSTTTLDVIQQWAREIFFSLCRKIFLHTKEIVFRAHGKSAQFDKYSGV